jgi:hypothetical protein
MKRRRHHKRMRMQAKPSAVTPVRAVKAVRPVRAIKAERSPVATAQEATPQQAESQQAEPQEAESQEQTSQEAEPQEQEATPQEEQEQEEQEQEEQEAAPQEVEAHGDGSYFPLVSSHIHGDTVRTTGVLISDHGCSLVHCNAMPRNLNIGVDRAAPYIAAVHRGMLRKLGKRETQRKVAEAFCMRARLGDQNAMAMMAMVRDNAKRGIPEAVQSFQYMKDFVTKNPVTPGSFGAESSCAPCLNPDTHGAVQLANGPMLSNSRISKVVASFGEENQQIILQGIRKWQSDHDEIHKKLSARLDSMQREILKIGRTLGKARALQIVRSPNGPIAAYSPSAAWELGE